jgi:hypothetical protein
MCKNTYVKKKCLQYEYDCDDDSDDDDDILFTACVLNCKSKVIRTSDNPTLAQAMETIDSWKRWQPVCEKEMASMRDKGVGKRIDFEKIPVDDRKNILQGKMDLLAKYLASGDWDKDKGRLCVMDCFNKSPAETYTYAPTGSDKALKVLIQISVIMNLLKTQLDFKSAYLSADLPFPRYMKLPTQFRDENGNEIFWKLFKAIYGMRESGYLFSEEVRSALMNANWKQCPSAPAVYVKHFTTGDIGLLFTYVDDEKLFHSSLMVLDDLLAALFKFDVIVVKTPNSFLGYDMYEHIDGTTR